MRSVHRERRRADSVALVHLARNVLVAAALASVACARSVPPTPAPPSPPRTDGRLARVSLGLIARPVLSATSPWQLVDSDGRLIARGDSGAAISLSAAKGVLHLSERGGSNRTAGAQLVLSVNGAGVASVNGRRYRGDLTLVGAEPEIHIDLEAPVAPARFEQHAGVSASDVVTAVGLGVTARREQHPEPDDPR